MLHPDLGKRARAIVIALVAPLTTTALLACDASEQNPLDPSEPQFADAYEGELDFAPCWDPTPGERWTVAVGPAGGTFNMGPNTVIVPANAVATTALISLRELSQTSLQVRVNSTVPLNSNVEIIMSTENCTTQAGGSLWEYDEAQGQFIPMIAAEPDTTEDTMRFWTIQPGAYALAD